MLVALDRPCIITKVPARSHPLWLDPSTVRATADQAAPSNCVLTTGRILVNVATRTDEASRAANRALQGIGGTLLTPGSLALISASFHDRAAAIGAWSGLGRFAGAVGPFLGGFLVEWSWQAVFPSISPSPCLSSW